jgi:phospholipid/cholesterol/gamma-HCH transport system substrate-binding protein
MKKDVSNKIKLGIFISIGMLLFIAGIYFIGQGQQLFRSTFRISGVFKDVAGLQAGNAVRLSGVNVGTVDNIRIESDSSIRVEILIDERTRVFIKKDAMATIGSEGLMGNKLLIITPGTGGKNVIEDGDSVATSVPMDLDDVMETIQTTIENTSNITRDLSLITANIQSGKGTIGKLLMDKTMVENFDSTFANLKDGSARFKVFMEKASELDAALISINQTMENTAALTKDLSLITGSIHAGNGTVGKLLMDSSYAKNIDSTLVNLKEGTAGLKSLLEKAKTSWLLWGY